MDLRTLPAAAAVPTETDDPSTPMPDRTRSVDDVLRQAGLLPSPGSDAVATADEERATERPHPASRLIDLCDAYLLADSERAAAALAERLLKLGATHAVVIAMQPADADLVGTAPATLFDAVQTRDLLAAADETTLCGSLVEWPPTNRLDRPAKRAIERAAATLGTDALVAVPVSDGSDAELVLLLAMPSDELRAVLATLSPTLGLIAKARREADATVWTRSRRAISKFWSERRNAIVGCVAAVGAVLACPWPYTASCDCELEPALRRFVAAPFDGRLDEVFVHPGDLVSAGQPLAQLDGSEIEFERAGLIAERSSSERERTATLSRRETAASQLATLERDRIDARLAVLERRMARLTVTAPLDGIIVDGELDRVRGMPLETGRTLFEVAPLDAILCQVHVPEYDVHEVVVGQPVAISLDASPWQTVEGTVVRIRPRAEQRDSQTVFIAEVELPNLDGTLRPGMTGQADVTTGWHPLAWNWLHRWYGEFRRGW